MRWGRAWVLLLAVVTGCAGEATPAERAADACQRFVSARLKAPGTAEFTRAVALQDGRAVNSWVSAGTVDAENSFGAKIRSSYLCRMHTDPDGGWVLEGIQGLG